MRRSLRNLGASVRQGFWGLPALCVVTAAVLALLLVRLDRHVNTELRYSFGAGPDGAREVLSAITTAMISVTGTVFSITVVVLQLTTSQYSPRVLRTFLRDRQTQWTLGVFVATFVYAVLVLRTVNGGEDTFVPAISTTVSLLLLLLSVGLFVAFIHHISSAIQVSSVIASIGKETRGTIGRCLGPDRPATEGRRGATVSSRSDHAPEVSRPAGAQEPLPVPTGSVDAPVSGVLARREESALVQLAAAHDVVFTTGMRLGDFAPEGAPLLQVHGEWEVTKGDVYRAIDLRRERSMQADFAFGIRQLVDIAEKALSPAINDPTTAVQALDELHTILRGLAVRPLPDGRSYDDDGALRLVAPGETMERLAGLALDEIAHYGADAPPIVTRVVTLLEDVLTVARPEHRPALQRRLAVWRERRTHET